MVRIFKIFFLSSGIFSSRKLSQAYKTDSILSSEGTDDMGRNLRGDPGGRLSGFTSYLCHVLTVGNGAHYLTSLCLDILICEMELITLRCYYEMPTTGL